jgi:hypothetical protein
MDRSLVQFIVLAGFSVNLCAAHSVQPTHVSATDALVRELQQHGATVTRAGPLDPSAYPFFSVRAERLVANEADVQVFEYATADRADHDAAKISPTGSPIGQVQISWMDVPHFYRRDRVIVLYVGHSSDMLKLLQAVLGAPFVAGR